MVLQGRPCGRVGRCRGFGGSIERSGPLFFGYFSGEMAAGLHDAYESIRLLALAQDEVVPRE